MIAAAERIPPTCNARPDRDTHQSNQPETLDGSNSERARLIAQRVRTDGAGFLVNVRPLGIFRGFRDGMRRAVDTVGGADRLIQCKLFCRPCHPKSSWTP